MLLTPLQGMGALVLFTPCNGCYIRFVVAISFYQPNQVNLSVDFPTSWNELTPEELERISHHQLQEYTVEGAAKAAIFQDLVTLRAKAQGVKLPERVFQRIDPEDTAVNALILVDFIFSENTLTKQPYPVLTSLVGPADDFNAITCGEFEDGEIFFHQFNEAPGPEPLARLAAVLYRPKGEPYLRFSRELNKYIPYDVEAAFPRFLKLDGAVLFTIYTWYTGCREMLPKYFPDAFGGDGGDESEEPDFAAFTRCIHGGAGAKNGTREQIRVTPLKEFFFELNEEAKKAKELRRQYAQMQRS